MTSPLLVEKRSQPADVFLSDGRVIEALVFVADVAQTYEGPQTVRDLMDEPGEVLPAVDSGGDFILIHKPAVSAISVLPSDQDLRGFWHESPATLRLGVTTLLSPAPTAACRAAGAPSLRLPPLAEVASQNPSAWKP